MSCPAPQSAGLFAGIPGRAASTSKQIFVMLKSSSVNVFVMILSLHLGCRPVRMTLAILRSRASKNITGEGTT
jgi:hypothetical protein